MKDNRLKRNPLIGFGLFLIALGLMLLAATLDVLGWGSMHDYFRWEMLLIFISLIMFLNGNLTGGVIFLAAGSWFILPDIFDETPELVRIGFWPAALVLTGITFLIPSPKKWCYKINN
ncbi:MAG: hypothetical protein R6W67_06680 [Bacteroidales bacterium]